MIGIFFTFIWFVPLGMLGCFVVSIAIMPEPPTDPRHQIFVNLAMLFVAVMFAGVLLWLTNRRRWRMIGWAVLMSAIGFVLQALILAESIAL